MLQIVQLVAEELEDSETNVGVQLEPLRLREVCVPQTKQAGERELF